MFSLSKKGLKQKKPLKTLSHPDPCIPKSTKGKNTGISYWSKGSSAEMWSLHQMMSPTMYTKIPKGNNSLKLGNNIFWLICSFY